METTEPASAPFTKDQILYTSGPGETWLQCTYMYPVRGDVHLVKVEEGEYKGTHYKFSGELLTEKPDTN